MDEKIEIRPGRYVNILVISNLNAKKTLFMLHGLGGRGAQWEAQYNVLKDHFTMIIPDLLGHGKSDKPKPDTTNLYSFQELDQDVQAIFARYASAHNWVAGHSYGGALATSLALAHPNQIEKLILVSPTPLAPDTKIPFLFTLPAPIMELLRPILERSMAKLIFDPTANPDLIESEMRISRQNPMYVIKSLVTGFLSAPKADVSGLRVPAVMILGEHDKLIPPAVSRQFYDALPDCKTVVMENTSHMAIMERPEKVTELILAQ